MRGPLAARARPESHLSGQLLGCDMTGGLGATQLDPTPSFVQVAPRGAAPSARAPTIRSAEHPERWEFGGGSAGQDTCAGSTII